MEREINMDNLSYIVNVEAVIYKKDKYLIIKRSDKEEHAPGMLSNVGGKVDTKSIKNDILEETLLREIKEEVGIQVFKPLYYVESKSFISDQGDIVIDVVFLCKYKSGEPKPVAKNEVSNVYWLSSKEILENSSSPIWLKESIKKADKIRVELLNGLKDR